MDRRSAGSSDTNEYWNLANLTMTVRQGHSGSFNFQVVATSVEAANDSMASVAKNVTVQLLGGQSCVTPAGVNPYISYANSNSASQVIGPVIDGVVASPLVPVSSGYAIAVPSAGGNGTARQPASAAELDASLENLLASLSETVGAALLSELQQ